VVPVGGNRETRLDVRVIAATNRPLNEDVQRGIFREDLFHRLRVVTLALPSLSERWGEFDAIVHRCLAELSELHGKRVLRITGDVARKLERHSWPGNLRELNNVLEYAVMACDSDEITLADLPEWFDEPAAKSELSAKLTQENVSAAEREFALSEEYAQMDYAMAMARFEKEYLSQRLGRNENRVNRTARNIGLHKTTLIRRMRLYGLGSRLSAQANSESSALLKN
jgi:two-component system nitrogen regulation response regulator NtrX